VISHGVARRTHEIGIRVALGATRTDIFRLVLSRGLALAAFGVVIAVYSPWRRPPAGCRRAAPKAVDPATALHAE
jgi:hypothetical protein